MERTREEMAELAWLAKAWFESPVELLVQLLRVASESGESDSEKEKEDGRGPARDQ